MRLPKSLSFVTLSALICVPAFAKDPNPSDYPLHVKVTAFANQVRMEYRGTDCTSTSNGEIQATETGVSINGTVSTRTYTTCDPNWAAHHSAIAQIEISSQPYLVECADVSKRASWASRIGALGNGMQAAGGTPDQKAQAQQQERRAQPLPPSSKCNLMPGDYLGRLANGKLELLLPQSNGKFTTVNYVVSSVQMKQPATQLPQPTAGKN
jgi:hypothetical protein